MTSTETKPAAKKTYEGGCHCGLVRYRVAAAIDSVVACNCSICQKSGNLLTFVPVGDFTLLSGADQLTPYKFNKHVINHLFCKGCGVKSFAEGQSPQGEMRAINIRCLDGVDARQFPIHDFDGRSQ